MHIAIASVVPNALRLQLERIEVRCFSIVRMRVRTTITSAADIATDETYPEVGGTCTICAVGWMR